MYCMYMWCDTMSLGCHLVEYYFVYCITYIGGNNVWRIARKQKKIAIGGYKFGSTGTISMPSPGVQY